MDASNTDVPANCYILNNSPALHSLKRQQLILLCKRNGIKASGKNAEIVAKLKAHALKIGADPSMSSQQPFSSDDDKENRRINIPRPSDQWTVIEEDSREIERVHLGLKDIREEIQQELGATSPLKGLGASQSSGEFGSGTTSSKGASHERDMLKGSSMSSSLKAFATSLKRSTSKLSAEPTRSTKLSTVPSINSNLPMHAEEPLMRNMLTTAPIPYHRNSCIYPLLPDPEPLNSDDSRDQSMLELGASTIRLVAPLPTAESPPKLRPFTPTFEPSYSPGTPSVPSIYPPVPIEQDSDPCLPGAFPNVSNTPPALPKISFSPAPPFLFGSPAHRISNNQFNSAAASVLAEMNARLGLSGTSEEVGLDILQKRHAEVQPVATRSLPVPLRTGVTSKFDKAHEREFERMEGLGTWYAKRAAASPGKLDAGSNKKRKSDALGDAARKQIRPTNVHGRRVSRVVTPGTRRSLVAAAVAEEVDGRNAKRVRISTTEGASRTAEAEKDQRDMDVDEETQKAKEDKERERAAIKKKLEVSRARRRSSMGRVSVGAGRPALIPNQPKKGIATKFGFLSSAKTLVKSVWNRGVGAPTTQPSKPNKSTEPQPSLLANRPAKSTSKVLTKAPPPPKASVARIPPVKVTAVKTDSIASLRPPSTGLGLGRKASIRSGGSSSVGTKSSATSSMGMRSNTASSSASGPQAARRRPIPSFQLQAGRFSRTDSLVSGGTVGSRASGTTSSRGGSIAKPGSTGTRNSGLQMDGNSGSVVRQPPSTLFAPTASSLAKMQGAARPPSMLGPGKSSIAGDEKGFAKVPEQRALNAPNVISGFTFTSPPQVGGSLSPHNGVVSIPTSGTSALAPPVRDLSPGGPKPRAVPSRRPRISRSRVIARLGEQRAASGPSSLTSTASVRRSLNMSKPRGSLVSARAWGNGAQSRGREAVSARKRLRQSEILRRRSKVEGVLLEPRRMERERAARGGGGDGGASDGEESATLEGSVEE